MFQDLRLGRGSAVATACLSLVSFVAAESHHLKDPDLFHFRTRPELKAPRWDVKVYNRSAAVTPGYWFVGVKPSLEETIGTGQGWFGPHIYDGDGELVWSGAAQFDTSNVMDFRISTVKGEKRLTVIDRDRQIGLVLDNHYEILESFEIDPDHDNVNAHELNFVDDGKSVLVIQNDDEPAPKEEAKQVGYTGDGDCKANYMAFREYDATHEYRLAYDWRSRGHIRLNESTDTHGGANEKCNTWDFIHANSLDKTPDGDYLYSGRHTDTIYKISHIDGSIVWRLGGLQSDFKMGHLKFSRQHDIRCRGQNETHTMISFLDNAKGQGPEDATHRFSRGLLLALRTDVKPMTVTVVEHYDHPYKDHDDGMYAKRRGNMQIMDNDHVFMGWSEQALHSEHAPNGELLMEAVFKADWLGSYRNYKFPFAGQPLTRPDVHAVSYFENEEHRHLPRTEIAVSWNGDTEVRSWRFHASTSVGGTERYMDITNRTGFETLFEYRGYLASVRLEGVDKDGETIGDSGHVKTIQHPSPPPDHNYVDSAENVNNDPPEDGEISIEAEHPFLGNPNVTFALLFILGVLLSAGAVLLGWLGYLPLSWLRDRKHGLGRLTDAFQYKKVTGYSDDDTEEDHELDPSLVPASDRNSGKIRLDSPSEPP